MNNDLLEKALNDIAEVKNLLDLDTINAKYLGKKGVLTEQLKNMATLSPDKKREAGQVLNMVKNTILDNIDTRKKNLIQQSVHEKLNKDKIDVTLPGRGHQLGRLHPITVSKNRIEHFFSQLGFLSVEGPEIEDDFHNFTALNIPENHPARANHDTFYFPDGRLLRTHTSPVQIRLLEKQAPPIRMIAMGRVYRCDSDLTHTPMFHQLEGLVIEKNSNFADLKNSIELFLQYFFEAEKDKKIPVRFRPSYFPFTEPSAEVDMGCVNCNQAGCRICKNTGWVEILGCGMVHPNVLKSVNIDPEHYSGYAFGVGIDRLTMLRYGINDLRLLFENDLKFLRQF